MGWLLLEPLVVSLVERAARRAVARRTDDVGDGGDDDANSGRDEKRGGKTGSSSSATGDSNGSATGDSNGSGGGDSNGSGGDDNDEDAALSVRLLKLLDAGRGAALMRVLPSMPCAPMWQKPAAAQRHPLAIEPEPHPP